MFGWLKDRIHKDSIMIVGVSILCVILIALLSRALNVSFFYSFMGVSALAWVTMHFYSKKLSGNLSEDSPVIYCEWEHRVNLTDFKISETTKLDLERLGLSLNAAVGSEFVFHTEPSLKYPDFYFEGTIVKEKDGNYLIRSSKKIPIKLVTLNS